MLQCVVLTGGKKNKPSIKNKTTPMLQRVVLKAGKKNKPAINS